VETLWNLPQAVPEIIMFTQLNVVALEQENLYFSQHSVIFDLGLSYGGAVARNEN